MAAQKETGRVMSREKACSRTTEWLKPHKLHRQNMALSLCPRQGGSQAASLRWRTTRLQTTQRCPGLPHTGKKKIKLIKVKMKYYM